MEVQHLIGLFSYWRQHIPYLQVLLQPLYKITKKAEEFTWGKEQEQAVKVTLEYIAQFRNLNFVQPDDTIIIDLLYMAGYGNWNIFAKRNSDLVPVGFYCKKFPWSEQKYSLFERQIWTAYEAIRTVQSLLRNNKVIIRTNLPIIDWIKAPGEAWAGLPMEGKVLMWKWFLNDFLRLNAVSAQGSVPMVSESILQSNSPMTPNGIEFPKTTPPLKQVPMGHWGTQAYNPSMVNAWFTDGSATSRNGKIHWKAAAFRPFDGKILQESDTGKSAQHAEVIAAKLAVQQSFDEKQKVCYIFTDSWCVANGIAIWSGKWKNNNWKLH
ncbi:uncharacterized protein LOC115072250 [Nannospalax galili]|uniref:uncharacterized protein LOC115072250 n=1 Tax=Nannospalax galili TaxID=1026970 RepID=UPI00111C6160|nr:uncharacterized protein LOC115072250 [Nannospalax galili]